MLGSYHKIREDILLETLSRETINQGSQGKYSKQNQNYVGYNKNKIKARFIPTPEGDLDLSEEQRLVKSGSCGALIHGLEDSNKDVRNAAIGRHLKFLLTRPNFY